MALDKVVVEYEDNINQLTQRVEGLKKSNIDLAGSTKLPGENLSKSFDQSIPKITKGTGRLKTEMTALARVSTRALPVHQLRAYLTVMESTIRETAKGGAVFVKSFKQNQLAVQQLTQRLAAFRRAQQLATDPKAVQAFELSIRQTEARIASLNRNTGIWGNTLRIVRGILFTIPFVAVAAAIAGITAVIKNNEESGDKWAGMLAGLRHEWKELGRGIARATLRFKEWFSENLLNEGAIVHLTGQVGDQNLMLQSSSQIINKLTQAQRQHNREIRAQADNIAELNQVAREQRRLAEEEGKTNEERLKHINNAVEAVEKRVALEKKLSEETLRIELNLIEKTLDAELDAGEKRAQIAEARKRARESDIRGEDELRTIITRRNSFLNGIAADERQRAIEKEKLNEEERKAEEARLERIRKAEEEIKDIYADTDEKRMSLIQERMIAVLENTEIEVSERLAIYLKYENELEKIEEQITEKQQVEAERRLAADFKLREIRAKTMTDEVQLEKDKLNKLLQNEELFAEEKELLIAESEDRIDAIRENYANKERERIVETMQAMLSAASQSINAIAGMQHSKDQQELERLDKLAQADIMSKEQLENKKREILLRQAKREKNMALFEAVVGLAAQVAKMGAITPQAIAAIAAGGIQIATIMATPLPSFKEGDPDFKGKGTTTSDSNVVRISNREAIIKAKEAEKFRPLLKGINEGKGEIALWNMYVAPALSKALGNKQTESGQLLFDTFNIERQLVRNKSVNIENSEAIAGLFAKKLSQSLKFQSKYK